MARVKAQLARRLVGLLRFIPMNGYDVMGVRMLGRRWVCSGEVLNVISYVRAERMLAQCFLIRSRILLAESLVWMCWSRSCGGHLSEQAICAMCGRRRWYLARHCE